MDYGSIMAVCRYHPGWPSDWQRCDRWHFDGADDVRYLSRWCFQRQRVQMVEFGTRFKGLILRQRPDRSGLHVIPAEIIMFF